MDQGKGNESSTVLSGDEYSPQKSPVKGILRKSKTMDERKFNSAMNNPTVKRMGNVKRTSRVCFTDKAKNLPISIIHEIEPIQYEAPESPSGKSCTCLVF
jgi:hypothetical protein